MNKIFVSAFFIGFLPFAPGTFGSLLGVLLGFLVQTVSGFPIFMSLTILLFFTGWYASKKYIAKNSVKHKIDDPQEIVIDEIVGQLISYSPISFYIWVSKSDYFYSNFYDWLIAFALFRLFDIFKPWPINLADKIPSALGVMLDDVIAGLYSVIIICILLNIN
tara:strand:+ start:272 stop:760 length:489 start_codon:yes stop_codon:yes gene_type:complete